LRRHLIDTLPRIFGIVFAGTPPVVANKDVAFF
jgi:hypothetical protein